MISLCNGSAAATGMLGAALFGRWSDKGHRLTSLFLVLASSFVAPLGPVLILGTDSSVTAWFIFVGWGITGAFRAQASGSPIFYTALAETLPPKYTEVGFATSFA